MSAATSIGWTDCACDHPGLWEDGWRTIYAELEAAIKSARRRGISKAEKQRIRTEVIPPIYDRLAAAYLGREDGYHNGPHWRPGMVLDPFAGTGTTLLVALGHSRDAIGIDLDERNADLALERVGPLYMEVDHG